MLAVCWLSAVLVLGACGSAADGQIRERTDCTGLDARHQITECRMKQLVSSAETLIANQQQSDEEAEDDEEEDGPSLGVLLSALSRSEVSPEHLAGVRPERSGDRPTYSMEHFRWGKPTSRKRRPVKVHASVTTDGEEPEEPEEPEESMETSSPSLDRRQLQDSEEQKKNTNTKSTTKYRITHFRWSAPPTTKRYGGFMKSWSEKSHKPLLTLLRNIIAKNRQ